MTTGSSGSEAGTRRIATDDGVELHCELRGHGPPLLLVQGGIGEAGATEQLVSRLSQHCQVISYDRRGLSRSAVPASHGLIDMRRHADDAAALLAGLTDRPAVVLGSSIGALIGLHLAVAHPDAVATVIAHEPPMSTVIWDPDREAGLDRVAATAERDVLAAVREMAALIGGTGDREADAAPGTPVGNPVENLSWFFRHDFPAVRASSLTGDQVAELPEHVTVIPTGGRLSRGGWENRCARQLADRLNRDLVELPGGHDALTTHPAGVAEIVVQLVAT